MTRSFFLLGLAALLMAQQSAPPRLTADLVKDLTVRNILGTFSSGRIAPGALWRGQLPYAFARSGGRGRGHRARRVASLRARVVRGPATVLAESGVVLHLGAVKELYR